MKVYFVRHGESEQNTIKVTQHPDISLSKAGLKQAGIVADRFKSIEFDLIISSSFERAKQTAEIIGKINNKKVIFSDLLKERKPATSLIGMSHEEAADVHELIKKNAHDSNWHYEDEENFTDVKARAAKFLDYLSTLNNKKILIVTHGIILRHIILTMTFGDKFDSEDFYLFINTFKAENTGITMCEKDETEKWKVLTWNDHAHLG